MITGKDSIFLLPRMPWEQNYNVRIFLSFGVGRGVSFDAEIHAEDEEEANQTLEEIAEKLKNVKIEYQ